jgi:hypothetical protein
MPVAGRPRLFFVDTDIIFHILWRPKLPEGKEMRPDRSIMLSGATRTGARMLRRPQTGFYGLRLLRTQCAPVPALALVYQLCPMLAPQPTAVSGPNPERLVPAHSLKSPAKGWRACRRQARRGRPSPAARFLRPVSPNPEEYALPHGLPSPAGRCYPGMPEAPGRKSRSICSPSPTLLGDSRRPASGATLRDRCQGPRCSGSLQITPNKPGEGG